MGNFTDREWGVSTIVNNVAFEAASGFSWGFALGGSFGDVGLGLGTVASAGDGNGVERSVELAVTAAVEAVTGVLAGGGLEGRDAG